MRAISLLLCFFLILPLIGSAAQPPDIKKEYQQAATQIVGAALVETEAYDNLDYLSNRIGNRLSGTPQLDQAIEWAVAKMKADGLENVHTEAAKVPHWVRGAESAEIVAPLHRTLSMLGLGGSVGTPPEGISAEVVQVRSYEELDKLGESVKGKIVLFNAPMRTDINPFAAYGEAVKFRGGGASHAARYGAVATLIRSVTTVSLNTPHTGAMRYDPNFPKIPAAAITLENAEQIDHLLARGEKVVVKLTMGAQTLPDVDSANVIGELRGREHPEEVVVVGGHIDSWDVGSGANDDGAGVVMAMEAVHILSRLNLRPRRTLRVVLFTNEENGLQGAAAYRTAHKAEFDKHIAAIESDAGAARPLGFSFIGKDSAFNTVQQIAALLHNLGADNISRNEAGADVSVMTNEGVPGLGLTPDPTHYFDVHHTNADTFEKINRFDLSLDVATVAVMAYVIADLPEPLSRQ
jgi:carboxypeptidase Q